MYKLNASQIKRINYVLDAVGDNFVVNLIVAIRENLEIVNALDPINGVRRKYEVNLHAENVGPNNWGVGACVYFPTSEVHLDKVNEIAETIYRYAQENRGKRK